LSEELQTLIAAVKADDEDAFSVLSETYAPLVRSMSARFAPSFRAVDGDASFGAQDLEQEARLALYRAAKAYDPEQKKVSFGLYAKICIRNSLVSALRKSTAHRHRAVRADVPLSEGHSADPLFVSPQSDLARDIAAHLSPYEKTVFDLYIRGHSVKTISVNLKRPEKSVSNAVYRIRVKIKGLI